MPPYSDSHVSGACYHVKLRGGYCREQYFAPQDRGLLITVLTEVIERFDGKVHCYSNDVDCLQLLIQVGEEPLGRMLLRVARRYSDLVQKRLASSPTGACLPVRDVVNRLFDVRARNTMYLAPSNRHCLERRG
jgi:hypothetical protein